MSEDEELPTADLYTKHPKAQPEVIPSDFATVHADMAMVAIDHAAGTASITLLQNHVIPKIGADGWDLDNIRWTIVGEVKIPVAAMNAVAVYYIQQVSNGLDVSPMIGEYLRKHPINLSKGGITYGPTAVRPRDKP